MNPKEIIADKRLQAKNHQAKMLEIDTLARKIKDELFSVGTPASIQSFNELSKSVDSLNSSLSNSVKEIKAGNVDATSTIVDVTDSYRKIIDILVESDAQRTSELEKALSETRQALRELKTIDIPEINTKGIESVLKELLSKPESIEVEVTEPEPEDEGVDLDDFKAHDLKEDGDVQYIGFMNQKGAWYIVENNTVKNSLRYVFGINKYKSSFKKAGVWEYKTLSEAINALQA